MAFGIGEAIAAGLKVIDKFVPDPEAKAKAEGELRASLLAWDQGQIAVNTAEAGHSDIFVAGWRPFIGWVCGVSMAYQYVITPVVLWLAAILGFHLPTPPRLDDMLWEMMFGMLGIAGLRTFEKVKGISR